MKKSLGAKTIVYPTPVFIVATYDKEGKSNAMNAAWGGICCSNPPCVYVSLRKATYTYENIMEKMAYTVNIPSEKHIKEADYFGMVTGRDKDKFAITGLTPVKSDLVDAPYIKEFPINLHCKVVKVVELGLHTEFVGEIIDVYADADVMTDGVPDMTKLKPMLYAPEIQQYFAVGSSIGMAFSIGSELRK